jgi:hypothetical protein
MLWQHAQHPGRRVRLAYCLNVHAAETLDEVRAGITDITLPLRDRLTRAGEPFGVGLYLSGAVARALASPNGARDLEDFARFLARERLDPFTYNAFPFGGFHGESLKERVFEPTWMDAERLSFTRDVARIAAHVAQVVGGLAQPAHVSISTHSGAFGRAVQGDADLARCAANLARAAHEFSEIERQTGVRLVLAIEAEPRATAGDNAMLERFLARVSSLAALAPAESREPWAAVYARHLGTCLDACHSAVEFETPVDALALCSAHGPIGKIQFSSALALVAPVRDARGVAELLACDEPRYLHQVTGIGPGGRVEVDDLPQLARALASPTDRARWESCDEWRCHFHVPVDLERSGGLATTRAHADAILSEALARPASWGTDELHVEIETYTWDVLPGRARSPRELVDGLEREYRHVIGVLERANWVRI